MKRHRRNEKLSPTMPEKCICIASDKTSKMTLMIPHTNTNTDTKIQQLRMHTTSQTHIPSPPPPLRQFPPQHPPYALEFPPPLAPRPCCPNTTTVITAFVIVEVLPCRYRKPEVGRPTCTPCTSPPWLRGGCGTGSANFHQHRGNTKRPFYRV